MSVWFHVRSTTSLLAKFAPVCFLRDMPECLTGSATGCQNNNHNTSGCSEGWLKVTFNCLLSCDVYLAEFSAELGNRALNSKPPGLGSFGHGRGRTPGWLWLTHMAMQPKKKKRFERPVVEWLNEQTAKAPVLITLLPSTIPVCGEKTLSANWNEMLFKSTIPRVTSLLKTSPRFYFIHPKSYEAVKTPAIPPLHHSVVSWG